MALAGCSPDLSEVGQAFSSAVDGADTTVGQVAAAYAEARKTVAYEGIAHDDDLVLVETGACATLKALAVTRSAAGANPGGPAAARRDRASILKTAALDCAVVAVPRRSARTMPAPPVDARLGDAAFLCGVDKTRITVAATPETLALAGGGARAARVPAITSRAPEEASILPHLVAYADALGQAAAAPDIDALRAAGKELAASFAAAAKIADPSGVAASGAVEAISAAANALAGTFLRQQRFRLVRDVVREADRHVRDLAAIACHGTLLMQNAVVRDRYVDISNQITAYDLSAPASAGLEAVAARRAVLERLEGAVIALRAAAATDLATPMVGLADAHAELGRALQSSVVDLETTIERLERLGSAFDAAYRATTSLIAG